MEEGENGQEVDTAGEDGMHPDRNEGPGESESSPVRSEFRQGENTSGPDDAQFQVMDQVFDEFPIEPIPVVMGADGLPEIVTGDPRDAQAIPFTYETQLCLEDDREYVEMFEEEMIERGWLPPLSSMRIRIQSKYDGDGRLRERRVFPEEEVESRWGMLFRREPSSAACDAPLFIPVRPRRERCRHYRRQVFSNDSQPDPSMPGHQIVFRVCTARRSNGGAYMSISNEGIYACDFRDPPDLESRSHQDEKDKRKLRERPDKVHLPLFGGPGDEVRED